MHCASQVGELQRLLTSFGAHQWPCVAMSMKCSGIVTPSVQAHLLMEELERLCRMPMVVIHFRCNANAHTGPRSICSWRSWRGSVICQWLPFISDAMPMHTQAHVPSDRGGAEEALTDANGCHSF
eukprot:380594-Pelagomonas_calceolata.AAC.2